ncbi:tape measure protein [Bacteroides stercoris]|jgi:tape measure domain-containing protein|uniref:tape measure protein n=2 Tax=Bacteroides stercoris TaxID=46506 RepID=UPI000E4A8B32|nr:tape measure protein [Bacteroides stercoris]KAB5266017.1 tape measure protein [Bacteroides stercoris]MDU6604051.1 tape measure protein [Bacteroides stercoris]MDU7623072.1 tape measure protein [Bacteroides stercoris]RGU43962.1 phage tail tape measure protein [Bacteroides stercoris]
MAKLYFKVGSDWEEVVRLRNEIAKLKQELMSMDGTQSPAVFKALNAQLAASNQRLDELVTNAAKAGAEMETGFKRKIFDASQVVNGFTEKILAQKAVVKDIEADVKRLGDAYRIALKRNPLSANGKLEEYNAARKALDEEKAALFGLTQQQAEARLSVKKLRDEYTLYKNDGRQVVETNEGIAISWKKALAVIGGAGVLKALGSEIIRVRGEFQSMQTAIETMVGKDVAGQLIPQIKELAKISPLTMSDMVGAEKMMLGFNIQAEDTIKYLKAISDISMGESSKFNSLTLAFSQMSAAGKLMGQDLNQMINAGFNPLQIISEKTGKSIATLKDEMSKGAVSAEMVQQAFIDATSAGGKFYNMSENASKTINGQLSMMQDALDSVFNELGTKSESVIMDGIQMTTSLIQNYETVGKVLAGLVVTYGTYRTAVMLVTAAESKHTLVEIGLTNARLLARKAQLALNASMLTNPYVALTVVIGGLATTMWAMSDSTTAAARAQKEYNGIKDAAFKKEQEHKLKIEELLTAARDESLATLTRQKSLEELRKEYPKIFEQYDIERLKLENILKLKQKINEEDSRRSVQGRRDDYNALNQTIANQRRYLQLFDNPDLRKNMSDSDAEIWKMFSGNQSYVQVREQMEKNSELLKKYQKDMLDDNISAYKSNLKNYSKEKLEAELKLAQSSASKRNGFVVNGMMVKGGDLESVISSINGALAKKKSPTTYKQDYEKAKKDWDDAKKKLSEIEKDKSKFTSKQYEEAKKRVETTEKAYKNLGGITGSSLTKQDNQTEKLRKQTDKYNALLDKQSLEQQRSAEDLQMEVDEARIKAMDEGSAKTIAEMELNFEKEMQAIDRQKKDALRKKVEDARAAWEANPKKKGKSFDATDIKLSDDEQNYYDELYKIAIISNEKIYKDLAEHYLSYADERLAIEKKFNDDISILQEARKKAEAKGDASEIAKIDRSVEKRTEIKNEDIFKLDAEQFKKNMNWEQVFGNLDKVSTDTLKKLKVNLKDFISSQKDLSPENLKELVDAIERIDDKVSERNPFEAMSVSFKSLKDATDAQREAQEAYNKTLKEGTDEEKKNAKATLESAKNNKQKALSEATTILHHGVDEIGQYVDAGNQVIGIMETLGTKTPEWLEGTMSGFGEMLDGLGSIDLMKPMSIVTGGLQTIKGALTSITSLGGVINWSGSNAKEVQDSINRLTDRNETLQTSIESLTDEIKASKGTKSVAAYRSAYEYQKEQNSNYLNIAREQAGYHNSHKSWQYYMRWSAEDLKWIQQNVNKNFTGTSSLWELTPEEMEKLRSNVDIWTKMQNAGKGGYGERVTDKLDDYIEQAGKLEELTDSLYEGLTGMSFDSMYDSFVSSLMDMEKSAEDVADDISKYFMQAMLSNAIGEQFSDKLRTWYDKFGEAMKDDGTLDNNERKELMDEYMGYVDEAMKLRDELAAATGYDKISQESTSQSASSKGFQAMSQDTGEELNGRFTALQIAGEEIKNQNIIQSQSLNLLTVKADAILSMNTETRNIADDTRNLIAQSYLELVQISENTGAIVKPIIQIQKDMAEVKNNTSKL